jgi:hypothetical protein
MLGEFVLRYSIAINIAGPLLPLYAVLQQNEPAFCEERVMSTITVYIPSPTRSQEKVGAIHKLGRGRP